MPCPDCRCPSCLTLVGSTIPSTKFKPPPSEFMTSNRAATNLEVAYSRDVISASETAISLIRTATDDLERRRAELLGLISGHKVLLAEIFTQFVTMMKSDYRQDLTPPLMLMGICSRWRRIVLNTPRLWTKILQAHPMIDSWISRSGVLPLHVELDLFHPSSHPALEALIPHSHRWEHVNFDLTASSISTLARVKSRLHSLKRLDLSFSDVTGTVDFCEVAPQLTEIMLETIFEPIIIKLPWEQLRHYALQHAKNLRVLHLDTKYKAPEPPTIRFDHDWAVTGFDIVEADRAELASALAGFFERSCTRLNRLELIGVPFSQSALIGCLTFSPSLVSFDIQFDQRWYAIDDELLHRLDVRCPTHILPRIRSLSLRQPNGTFIA
ncbi:hypothetical protein BD779DRAFT_1542605, partial [Infundibulicybe gibba]